MASSAAIVELILRWQNLRAQGQPVTPEELCADTPELLDEFRRQLKELALFASAIDRRETVTADFQLAGDTTGAAPGRRTAPLGPTDLPGYEILGELGRGGMGVVYKARHVRLERVVALKMILAGEHAAPAEVQRFLREARAVAALAHPHIVPIHEIGEHNGLPYFTLEFMDGGSLAAKVREHPLPPLEAAGFVEQLAHGMHYAHGKDIVHRDLKPENVLLAADGTPKITDFGLAKHLQTSPDHERGNALTATGAIMGTPSYMAPEQAAGKGELIGPLTDIYALGAILYRLVTGRPPFQAATPLETVMQVVNDEPVAPSRLQPRLPRDLETICLKCLQKEPAKRYASAQDLADDLRRAQTGEPIRARPVGRLERGWRWCRRKPALAASLAAAVASLVIGSIVSIAFGIRASENADAEKKANEQTTIAYGKLQISEKEARDLAEKEKKARDQIEDDLATSTMQLARARFEENNAGLAEELIDQVPLRFRDSAWKLVKSGLAGSPVTLRGHQGYVTSVAFTPDGQTLASGSYDQTVKLWDARTGQELRTFRGNKFGVTTMAFTPDGHTLATNDFFTVKLWDTRTGQVRRTLRERQGVVESVAFAPDGLTLASAGADQTVTLWDAQTGQELRTLRGHQQGVRSVAFAPDGRTLASASSDNTVKLWDTQTGQELRTFRYHNFVTSVAFAPDGRTLATGNVDKTLTLWETRTGQDLRILRGHQSGVASVAFTPDGRMLASASYDGTVKLWDPRTGEDMHTFRGHQHWVAGLAFAPDGRTLASASYDNTIKLWDARAGEELRTFRVHRNEVTSVAFTPDAHKLASGSWDKTVTMWDARTGKELGTLHGHHKGVRSLAFSSDGQTLASGSEDKTVKLWDARTGQEVRTLRGHRQGVTSVAFAPDGRTLASGSEDRTVKLWDARTGEEVRNLRGHQHIVTSVAFASDDQTLASASYDNTIMLWNARTGQELRTLRGHQQWVTSVAFTPDGKTLASGSMDSTVKLWHARTGQELHTLRGHKGGVTSVAFAPDSRTLATGGWDKTVKLWDARTGQELRTLRGHQHWIDSVAFAPDGRMVASGSHDKSVKLWDTRIIQESRTLRVHQQGVKCVDSTPDGRMLAGGSDDTTVRLWDARTGQELRTFRGHRSVVKSVAFSHDGTNLYSWDDGGNALGWTVADGNLCSVPESARTNLASASRIGEWVAAPYRNAIYLFTHRPSPAELSFRLWWRQPDPSEHQRWALAEENDRHDFSSVCQLGHYLSARERIMLSPWDPASAVQVAANGHSPLTALAGYSALEDGRRAQTAFVDGATFAGILLKDSGRSPQGLVIRAQWAVDQWPKGWRNREVLGAALYRVGDYKGAVRELIESHKLHAKEMARAGDRAIAQEKDGQKRSYSQPSIFSCHFFTLAHHKLGDKEQAESWRDKAVLPKDASWEDSMIDRYLRREVEAELKTH